MKINLPKIIGHRGLKDIAPENTIESIKESYNNNLKWVEVDVKTSKDRIPFLMHDDLLDRTTNGKGSSCNYLYKEIVNLDAGSWFNKKFVNIYPPSLEEVINYCEKKRMGINIELKPHSGKEKELVEAVYSLIIKKKPNIQFFFSSFDFKSLKLIRKKLSKSLISYLIYNINKKYNFDSIIKKCLALNCFSIGFDLKIVNDSLIQKCKKNNFKTMVYSDQNIEYFTAIKLWSLGVDTIFIDNPISYRKILQ